MLNAKNSILQKLLRILDMKKSFFIALMALITSTTLFAQDVGSSKRSNNVLMVRSHGPGQRTFDSPLYHITVDNNELQIPENGDLGDSTSIANALGYINPDWIHSINVLTETSATDKYNSLGKNGVIFIELKTGTLEKMPVDFKKRFKPIN
jgi:hypothetical protein